MKIKTFWIHDQFALQEQNKESLTVLENNGITFAIDAPSHIIKSLHKDVELVSNSIMTKVDYLLVTHTDNDHISWLANLLWWKVFWEKQKLNLITHPNIYTELWEILKRNGFWFDRTKTLETKTQLSDYCNLLPLWYAQELEIPWFWHLQSFTRPTHHQAGMDVLSFQVFDDKNQNQLNFSSDTSYDAELIEFLLQHDGKVIHEIGSYTNKSHSHTDIWELLDWIPKSEHQRIFVNHIPEIRESEILKTIQEYSSKIKLATFIY